jgi:uncharacterized membrane protein YccC
MSASIMSERHGNGQQPPGAVLMALRPYLFHGLRLAASVTLAYFIAYTLQLDNAYWSGITSAVVCQPSLGASLRKGRVRAAGTICGAIAVVLLIVAFPQSRVGMLLGLALWIGLCGFVATILRNFGSYGAALAAFTASVIFTDVIDAPGDAFILAATRVSEIYIGIFSAAVIFILTQRG